MAALLGLAACGTEREAVGASGIEVQVGQQHTGLVPVQGVDYRYVGLPNEVPVGATFTFTNNSTKEYHEMVLLRIADGETRPVPQLLALSESERERLTTLVGVSIAGPLAAGSTVEGVLAADQPGRYVVLCFLPVGATPSVVEPVLANSTGDGPPDFGPNVGPPHFTQGMVAEFTAG
jgi:hypothetical protein